ncbi:low-specificity L-threonine aldolase [Simiduia sp. 21SJ11W-1]|uniref:low-specificity L-threonine aldolase n=1 Tax=Simiduia sp. 21SJ11W-1 TaxID=2909669 RepID=UPI00209C937C|nr:low-specificity L-threonine aldolase [Simiduia sp. 21SJ11W-1]UTA49337.1 low-specificity L-threonine aldolase [Simiduia sp. 21SJ11W-1]
MIDFRSDTVTRPCAAMRKVMAEAEVGDDVFGDDPTVNMLEAWAAERHGFEAALFTASGTQANLLGILGHCERGDEYICGQQAHNYRYEAGGAAVLGSVQPQPLPNQPDGTLALADIAQAIKPDDSHFARTKLVSLENTIGGKVLPLGYTQQVRALATEKGLQLHLDGARAYNGSVAMGVDIAELAQPFDSMTICLSKGLGAPVGSLLLGPRDYIQRARRLRKMLGGGMRQAGILAAAGYYALRHNVERLAEDHENARYLAQQLQQLAGFDTAAHPVQTNIVFVDVSSSIDIHGLAKQLHTQGIFIIPGYQGMRLVTHKDIDRAAIDTFIGSVARALT